MSQKATAVVQATTERAVSNAKLAMQDPKSGRTYIRGGKIHTASAPGQAPAVDTGNLINSTQAEHTAGLTSYFDVYADYAQHLEFGTRHIAPRPFMAPALEKEKAFFEKELGRAVFETRGVT
jgi:HK97 gp10 family phage protein